MLMTVGVVILLAIVGINFVAYMQARAMTHFVVGAARTPAPEELTRAEKIDVLLFGIKLPRPVNTLTPGAMGLEYQTVRFGGAKNDDCEAWHVPASPSRGLVIGFHGYSSCKSSLVSAALAFHELGYDVMLVDFRGSGGSVGDITTLGYSEAEDVKAAFEFAQQRWAPRNVVLYGASMGGAAVIRAVGKLGVKPSGIIVESVFDRLLSTVENRFRAMGLPAFPLAQLLVFWGGEQLGYDGFAYNPEDDAKGVSCPTLIFQGGLDPRVTTPQARSIFENLSGPKEFELFSESGHCCFLGDDPNRWKQCVSKLLASASSK